MIRYTIQSRGLELTVGLPDGIPFVTLKDIPAGHAWAEGPAGYEAAVERGDHAATYRGLCDARLEREGDAILLTGTLAGLRVRHRFAAMPDGSGITERLSVANESESDIHLLDVSVGIGRVIASRGEHVLKELEKDAVIAVPFRRHPSVHEQMSRVRKEFTLDEFLHTLCRQPMPESVANPVGFSSSRRWNSEGWIWLHGDSGLGIFKYNQEHIEFSILQPVADGQGVWLRMGGAAIVAGLPACIGRLAPGDAARFGETTYCGFSGDYTQGCYVYRNYLDSLGMRFPDGYNPPVHWNELNDNGEWRTVAFSRDAPKRNSRKYTFTKEKLLLEAGKAAQYSCQTLYMDPGWDVEFGSMLWSEEWLGNRKAFIDELKRRFGLRLSLHTALAAWASTDTFFGTGFETWPRGALRRDEAGRQVEHSLCIGSREYIRECVRRIVDNVKDGVAFIMMDGNWFSGECHDAGHGHALPYGPEDHWRAQMEIVSGVHAHCPDVLIELHDPVTNAFQRFSPIYYQYGAAGSYNEIWAFEMMWNPLSYIKTGKANILYYYNLCCNIPLYVQIDLKYDNAYCLALWWFASTCRHFGIGGTHEDLWTREAQKEAMKEYVRLEAFYKRGTFYGFGEQVHVHALAERQAFVMNLFNLSDEEREIEAVIRLADIGLDPNRWYVCNGIYYYDLDKGDFIVKRALPPWSARVYDVYPVEGG